MSFTLVACKEGGTADPVGDPDAGGAQADADTPFVPTAPKGSLCAVSESLLDRYCVGCHNGSVQSYDLRKTGLAERITSTDSPRYPGNTMVVPGEPESSFLLQKIAGTQPADTGGMMPPRSAVPPEALETLREWIAAGAPAECEQAPTDPVESLDPTARVVRASLALRGVRPTPAELARADELPTLVDEWLETDEFGEMLRDMHDESMLLRVHEGRPSVSWKRPLPTAGRGQEESFINSRIQEAPLKLVEYVVRTDRPYTEILTADYAIGNDTMEIVWGTGQDGGIQCDAQELADFPSWKRCEWVDQGRGGAGVLSSTFFYVRWRSTNANQNRARANAITNTFLCYDFLDRPVPLEETDVDLADVEAVANAVRDNPACASCHESLDPIASFLYGFRGTFRPGNVQEYPVPMYNTNGAYREGRPLPNLRTPALFGQPGTNVEDLGRMLAEHPDFGPCAVRRMYAFLDQRPIEEVPDELVATWAADFVSSGFDAKAILKKMVLSDEFNVSHATGAAGADELIGLKKVRPEQAARMVEALTGFVWQTDMDQGRRPYGLVELMRDARYGYRVLAGGLDGVTVVTPAHTYNPPAAAVWQSFASAAADHVVESDFALPQNQRRLLTEIEVDTTDAAALRTQIASLYWAILAEQAADEELDAALMLYQDVANLGGADASRRGWRVLLSALLQDVRFTHY